MQLFGNWVIAIYMSDVVRLYVTEPQCTHRLQGTKSHLQEDIRTLRN